MKVAATKPIFVKYVLIPEFWVQAFVFIFFRCMQQTNCDASSYTKQGFCHFITSNSVQTITDPVWTHKTSSSILPIRVPDLQFTFDNLNGIDNYGATLVPGKVRLWGTPRKMAVYIFVEPRTQNWGGGRWKNGGRTTFPLVPLAFKFRSIHIN